MKRTLFFLFVITILAGLLRFYRLGEIHEGLHRDEAFLGYNAYSVLKTGRDMNGNFLPLHLASFLYSPAGYSYLSIPFISVFDLSAFSTRFASAFFGTLTVIVIYFLARTLFLSSKLSALGSFLLAVSAWHINLSRTATENVIVVFFLLLGTLSYFLWMRKKQIFLLIFSMASFALTLLLYQAPRAFLPFFIPLLFLIFRSSSKKTLAIGLYAILILLPLIIIIRSPELSLRIKTVSLFATAETQLKTDELIREDGTQRISGMQSRLFHNKLIGYAQQFMTNYFSHFSYDFLFGDKGLPDRYRVANSGLLYLFELPLVLLGLIHLLQKDRRNFLFLTGWVALVPIGSALTFDDVPNLQRTLLMLPAFVFTSATGLAYLISSLPAGEAGKKYQIFLLFYTLFLVFNISYYFHQYYVHLPVHQSWFRHEGYKELITKVNDYLPSFEKVIITNRESAPTVFFLFYNRYDPAAFQKEIRERGFESIDRASFGPFTFTTESCPLRLNSVSQLTGVPNILYVNGGECKTPAGAQELNKISRRDGSVVFRLVSL